jgi:hypothetical protein
LRKYAAGMTVEVQKYIHVFSRVRAGFKGLTKTDMEVFLLGFNDA